jgi:hypothetical protein
MKILLCVLMPAGVAMTAFAADVSGNWQGPFTPENGDAGQGYVILKQTGTELTGSGGPDANEQWPLSNGKIVGNKITGEVKDPNGVVYKLDLVFDGEHIKGDILMTSPEGQTQKAKLELTRVK